MHSKKLRKDRISQQQAQVDLHMFPVICYPHPYPPGYCAEVKLPFSVISIDTTIFLNAGVDYVEMWSGGPWYKFTAVPHFVNRNIWSQMWTRRGVMAPDIDATFHVLSSPA